MLLAQSTIHICGWDAAHNLIGRSPNLFSCLIDMRCDSAQNIHWYLIILQGSFVMRQIGGQETTDIKRPPLDVFRILPLFYLS
jgi:hypothetical protein